MPTPYYEADGVTLHLGDSLSILPTLGDASVDAIVTDPPYELGFMGKAWDASGIAYNVDLWRQCWRVLKPGGHLLAFGGTRTYHRMTVAIEDAGFEIRDSLHWIYGSGFPKGQDIAKSIDRRRDDRDKVLRVTAFLAAARDTAGWTTKRIDELFGFNGMANHWTAKASKAACVPTMEQWAQLRAALDFADEDIDALVAELNGRKGKIGEAWSEREVVGQGHRVRGESDVQLAPISSGAYDLTAPATDAARQWQGWNTALKPAHEPIVLARKSTGFNTTVANVLEHGTGALNIDRCRTAAGQDHRDKNASVVGLVSNTDGDAYGECTTPQEDSAHAAGRWPTNILLGHGPDCIDGGNCQPACPVADMDQQSGITGSNARLNKGERHGAIYGGGHGPSGSAGERGHRDSGGASRFFPVFRYEAKAPASERPRLADGTAHTTVKPLALMRWLIRLVTPPGGTVLDPFAGSGTTLEAGVLEGFNVTGIERDEAHAQLCQVRLEKPLPIALFGDIA
jgi:DNA modification methylase